MLSDALSYPANSDDRIATILIGGILSVLGILVIPAFIIQGYMVRVLRGAIEGDDAAPSFTDWGTLIVDGIKLFVVNVVYGLVIAIPLLVLTFVLGLGSAAVGGPNAGAGPGLFVGAAFLVGSLIVLLVALVVGYFVPAAMANFAVEDSLGAAFDVSTVWAAATTREYFVSWLAALVVGVVGGLIGSALSVVVVGVFVLFYVQVVTYYLFGRGFVKGLAKKRRGVVGPNV